MADQAELDREVTEGIGTGAVPVRYLLLRPAPWPSAVGTVVLGPGRWDPDRQQDPAGARRLAAMLETDPSAVERVPVGIGSGRGWLYLDRHAYRRQLHRNEAATRIYAQGCPFREGVAIHGPAVLVLVQREQPT